VYSNQVKYSSVRLLREIDVLMQKKSTVISAYKFTMHKTLVTDWLTYAQNIL